VLSVNKEKPAKKDDKQQSACQVHVNACIEVMQWKTCHTQMLHALHKFTGITRNHILECIFTYMIVLDRPHAVAYIYKHLKAILANLVDVPILRDADFKIDVCPINSVSN
jgi:hypothetical protein